MKKNRRRLPAFKKIVRPPKFYRALAQFTGYCGICNTSYQPGEPIYWCRKTPTTRTMRCHQNCYLQRTRAFMPSSKPSPPESELKRLRETSSLTARHSESHASSQEQHPR